eukprot:00006.XXX_1678_1484_1 [CDS] Oithona nana genome sequencing.
MGNFICVYFIHILNLQYSQFLYYHFFHTIFFSFKKDIIATTFLTFSHFLQAIFNL